MTPHWQNLMLQILYKGCFLRVQVQDFTVRHCSRSKLTDWTSKGWIEDKMTSKIHGLTLQLIVHAKHELTALFNNMRTLKFKSR